MSETRSVYARLPELAQRWGVTERTIYRWVAQGRISGTAIPFPYSRTGRRLGWTQSQIADIEADMIAARMLRATAS